MKIKNVFDCYKEFIRKNPKSKEIFKNSGMVNDFGKLDFGFFPLGSGILTEKSKLNIAVIEEGGTLVLGNDFGTLNYVENKCYNKREENSKTIDNLKSIGLKLEKTFFSNLFLGLRDNITHEGTTMTKLVVKRQQEYIDFCFEFFKMQFNLLNPKIVICLGTEVGKSLAKQYQALENFSQASLSLTKMFEEGNEKKFIVKTNDKVLGKRKFILIPHPSYAHINWNKNDIKRQIAVSLKS